MSQYAALFDLSTIDGTNGFRINGPIASGFVGCAVSSAGDFNNDGVADMIVGGYGPSSGPDVGPGAAFIIYGSAAGLPAVLDLGTLTADQGFALAGIGTGDFTGKRVAGVGDINGDGIADVAVGAARTDPGGNADAGSVYVVFGHQGGPDPTLAGLDGSNGFRVDGLAGAHMHACASAGDLNGDGFDDLVVASQYESGYAGAAYVVFGSASGFAATLNVADIDGSNGFRIRDGVSGDYVGASVAAAGDVNGDGLDDLIVTCGGSDADGKVNAGRSYVIFGSTGGFAADFDPSTLNGSDGFAIIGAAAGDFSGTIATGLGDINGDGFADVAVSAYSADPGGRANAGSAFVVFGSAAGFGATLDLGTLDGANGFRMDGLNASDFLGSAALSSAGDVNADGFDDLIVASYFAGSGGGVSYVIFGKAGGFAANFDLASLNGDNGFAIQGSGAEHSGFSVAAAGDVNGDGIDDLIIGAPLAPAGSLSAAGAAYVIYGALPGEAVTRWGSAIGQTIHGSEFNDALHGRGGADLLIGHNGADLLDGGTGDDTLDGGLGADTISGGSGKDTASYADAAKGVHVDLLITVAQNTSGAGADTLVSIENLSGSAFADTLTGDAKANLLAGEDGKDRLAGGAGDDHLDGGAGADKLTGGAGADVMSGGVGKDIFVFLDLGDSTAKHADLITDLTNADRIDLHAIDANANVAGNQAFHLVGALSGHAGEAALSFSSKTGLTSLSLDVDGDGKADMLITITGDHQDFTNFTL